MFVWNSSQATQNTLRAVNNTESTLRDRLSKLKIDSPMYLPI